MRYYRALAITYGALGVVIVAVIMLGMFGTEVSGSSAGQVLLLLLSLTTLAATVTIVIQLSFTGQYASRHPERLPQWLPPPSVAKEFWSWKLRRETWWPDIGPSWAVRDALRDRKGLSPLPLEMPTKLLDRLISGDETRIQP